MTDQTTWRLKVFYDGQCPLCSREVAILLKRNKKGLVKFEDITDPAFDPAQYGLTMPQLIGSMHAITHDGTILSGIDVFAELYERTGLSWLAKPLRWRLTRPLMKLFYRAFAAIRPRFSGFRPADCSTNRCAIKPRA